MGNIAIGEIIELEDQKEFICFHTIQDGGKDYLLLMSNFKPLEVIFAEDVVEDGVQLIRKIGDPEEKMRLYQLFGEVVPMLGAQKPEKEPEPVKTANGEICSEGIAVGEFVTLENMGDYLCFKKVLEGGKEYLCLMSKSTPRKFLFAEEVVRDGYLQVQIITDTQLQQRLAALSKPDPFKWFKRLFSRKSKKSGNTP